MALKEGIKVAPSQLHEHHVYVMVYHSTLTIEEALELAREIKRVALNQQQKKLDERDRATGICRHCEHPLGRHEADRGDSGRLYTVCTVKNCNCKQ